MKLCFASPQGGVLAQRTTEQRQVHLAQGRIIQESSFKQGSAGRWHHNSTSICAVTWTNAQKSGEGSEINNTIAGRRTKKAVVNLLNR